MIDGRSVDVELPLLLPDAYGSEPSIAISGKGAVAVAANAGSGTGARLVTEGGYVWVSQNGVDYELALDPRPQAGDPPVDSVGCSCDTHVVSRGDQFFATTMYWTVMPLFNVNVVASEDAGLSWELRSPLAAVAGPVDRPWLAMNGDELLLVYSGGPTLAVEAAPEGILAKDIFLQRSMDGGRTWSVPAIVLTTHATRTGYFLAQPLVFQDRLLIPFTFIDRPALPLVTHKVAVVDLASEDVQIIDLSPPSEPVSVFDVTLSAGPAGVFAAWTDLDSSARSRLFTRHSRDGLAWDETRRLEVPGSLLQPWAATSQDGTVAIAFYGSDFDGSFVDIPEITPWAPRVALLSADGGLAVMVNVTGAPTFYGNPCNFGLTCGNGARSPMREYLGAAWGTDGSLRVAYVDATDADGDKGRVGVGTVRLGPP